MATKTVSESRKACEAKLLMNPKYDSDWVQNAAKLMDEYDCKVGTLEHFNAAQLDVIYDAKEFFNDMKDKKYSLTDIIDERLNATQMQLMFAGWRNDIPRKILLRFVSPDIPYEFSNYALQAYLEGNDMSPYINKGFDRDQFYEIFCGLHNKVDVSVYAIPTIPAKVMGLMRHGLEIGYDAAKYDDSNYCVKIHYSNLSTVS